MHIIFQVTKFNENVIASSWSELGKVFIWDLSQPMKAVNDQRVMATYLLNNESPEPIFTYSGHLSEGYALEWSPLIEGKSHIVYYQTITIIKSVLNFFIFPYSVMQIFVMHLQIHFYFHMNKMFRYSHSGATELNSVFCFLMYCIFDYFQLHPDK